MQVRVLILVAVMAAFLSPRAVDAADVPPTRLVVLPVASDTDTTSGDALDTMYGLILSSARGAGETEVLDGVALRGELSDELQARMGMCGDPTCARGLGAALRAEEAVVTHIREFGRSRVFSLRIVDVRTGAVLADHIETLRLPEQQADRDDQLLQFVEAAGEAVFAPPAPVVGLRPGYAELGVGRAPERRRTEPPEGWHQHDGFFLRLGFGGGYFGMAGQGDALAARLGSEWRDPESHEPGFDVLFQVGGVVTQNLILHADFVMGAAVGGVGEADSVTQGLVGAGVTHYWMPHNVYVTGSLGYAFLSVSEYYAGDQYDDSPSLARMDGVGGALSIGKEWWVSTNWGLGLAARFGYAWQQGDGYDFNVWRIGLQFSSTYN